MVCFMRYFRNLAVSLLVTAFPLFARENQTLSGVPVLCYHQITPTGLIDGETNPYLLSVEAFEAQMKWLKKHGYRTIPLSTFAHYLTGTLSPDERKSFPAKPILISFDDGYRNFYRYARKIVNDRSFKVVIFASTGLIENHPRTYMSYKQLKKLIKEGHEVQSHSHSHPMIGTLSKEKQFAEFLRSKEILETKLETKIEWFAYPYGTYNLDTLKQIIAAGYFGAFTVFSGENRPLSTEEPENRYFLHRYLVLSRHSIDQFARIVMLKGALLQTPLPPPGSTIVRGEKGSVIIERGLDPGAISVELGKYFVGKNRALPFVYDPATGRLGYTLRFSGTPTIVLRINYRKKGETLTDSILYYETPTPSGKLTPSFQKHLPQSPLPLPPR